MAVKLIMRKSSKAFIEYIETADEMDGWWELQRGWAAIRFNRMKKMKRIEIRKTLLLAERAYEKRFGPLANIPF